LRFLKIGIGACCSDGEGGREGRVGRYFTIFITILKGATGQPEPESGIIGKPMVGTYSLFIFKCLISLFIPISLEVGRRKEEAMLKAIQ
jgi:hypothetical protein